MSKTQFQIDSDVAPPKKIPEIPFDLMNPGDSVKLPNLSSTDVDTVRQRMHRYQIKNPGAKLSLVKDPNDSGAMRLFKLEG